MTTLIREATTDDLEHLVDLLAEINNLHADELPLIYQRVLPSKETLRYLQRILESEELHLHVAHQAGKAVGMVTFQETRAPETPVHVPRSWVDISLIVVSQSCRAQGIGSELMRHVQAWAAERGINRIELQVAEFNAFAIAWYEQLGFVTQYRHMAWCADAGPDFETPSQRQD